MAPKNMRTVAMHTALKYSWTIHEKENGHWTLVETNPRQNYGKLHFECLNETHPVQEVRYDLLQRNEAYLLKYQNLFCVL